LSHSSIYPFRASKLGMPPTKISIVRECMATGRWREAVRIAARFPRLGDDKSAIQRAWPTFYNPNFCRQVGRDPEAMISAGREALRRRHGR
jgi:hypothetical protein